jgi:hypothetical protein
MARREQLRDQRRDHGVRVPVEPAQVALLLLRKRRTGLSTFELGLVQTNSDIEYCRRRLKGELRELGRGMGRGIPLETH